MANPPDRGPNDPPHNGRRATDAPRKGAFPLIWLLVLAALLAFAWSLYNDYAGETSPAPTAPTTPPPPPAP